MYLDVVLIEHLQIRLNKLVENLVIGPFFFVCSLYIHLTILSHSIYDFHTFTAENVCISVHAVSPTFNNKLTNTDICQ